MNIRRYKKKKNLTLTKNQQEIATDKLFQISYYAQEKYQDESNILAIDRHLQQKNHKIRRSKQFQEVIKKKNIQNITPKETISHLVDSRRQGNYKEEKKWNKTQNGFYNILESNEVFVGKGYFHKQEKNTQRRLFFLNVGKRMKTLPTAISTEKQYSLKKLKTEDSQCRFNQTQGKNPRCYKSLSLNKTIYGQNLQKIRQKLRQNLFIEAFNKKHQKP